MAYQYPLKFGKYVFTRRIAVGGMAEVFRAKLLGPKGFEKTLAVKRILPEYNEDEDFVQMFVDEARISSNLHHSNIVQVFDFGEVKGSYYIAMELVNGPNLKNFIQRFLKEHNRFPKDLAIYVCLQIAKALDYAHNVKIDGESSLHLVHRDVSPQNVLISGVGEVKITDFGIAKAAIKLSRTQPGKVQGKLSYMSPEQATGKSIDRRSDIFSLGIIFIELLTGVKVYSGENTGERYEKIREAKVPKLEEIVPDLPPEVATLAYQLVAKNPQDRPQNCQLVAEHMTSLLTHTSIPKLELELAELVQSLFPKEKSDSGIAKQIEQAPPVVEDGDLTSVPMTEVSMNRLPPSIPDLSEPHTKPIVIQPTEITSRRKNLFPLNYLLIGVLSVIFLGVVTHFLLREKKSDVITNVSPSVTPTQPSLSSTPSPEGAVASGPVDVDLREAAMERQREVENKLQDLEDEVRAAKQDAEQTAKELEKAQAKLAKITQEQKFAPCPKNMTLIKSGNFLIGSSADDPERNDLVESKLQSVSLPSFCIDKFEFPNKRGSTPLIRVSWNQAVDMCSRQGKRLCFQEEWERACKGPSSEVEDRKYAYGNRFRQNACNVQNMVDDQPKDQKTLPSGQKESCATKENVYDLSGNVDEWTFSPGTFNSDSHVTKGGSSYRAGYQSRCASIREVVGSSREQDLGFRCCKDANSP